MSARIIELAKVRASRSEAAAAANNRLPVDHTEDLIKRFQFWRGASGRRYVHSIYSLRTCPTVPAANYILVGRTESGRPKILAIGRAVHDAPSLNLAEIRQRGAELGACEVHIHLLADDPRLGKLIEFDLRTSLFGASLGGPVAQSRTHTRH